MAENEKEAYLALIAAHDPEIRTLLDQGFDFVTNAFKVGAAPSGMQARTDREHVRRLQQEGYQVLKWCTKTQAKLWSHEETMVYRYNPAPEPMSVEAKHISPPCRVSTH